MVYENLKKIENTDSHYYDTYNKFEILHAFHKSIDDINYFNKIKKVFNRRIFRLFNILKKSKKVIFIIATSYNINIDELNDFASYINDKYNTEVKISWLEFKSDKNLTTNYNNIIHYQTTREINEYDHFGLNFEWKFLDDVILNKFSRPVFNFSVSKKAFIFQCITCVNTIFKVELYLFGYHIKICIGKNNEYQFNNFY